MMKMMKMMAMVCVLLSVCVSSSARRLRLGNCSVNAHTHELHTHFHTIRQSMVAQDNHLGIKILKTDIMSGVQASESCCFLRSLLRFYVERVFGHLDGSNAPQNQSQNQRRTTGVLANAFLSIKKQLRQCHDQFRCQCSEQSKDKMEAIITSFEKLESGVAVVKAMGELGSVLDWMDTFKHTTTESTQ